MKKEKKQPYGYIYRACNRVNGKNYIGQTVTDVWEENQNPIEQRWKREVQDAFSKNRRGEKLRYIEYAIIKYGPENFDLYEEDTAQNQEELNGKENKGMEKYDTLNPEKGYNTMEVGRGGKMTEYAKQKMSQTHRKKWQEDKKYQTKQIKERRERAEDSDWLKKMTKINQERAEDPKNRKKLSEAGKDNWQKKEYKEKISKLALENWQNEEHRENQLRSRREGEKKSPIQGNF